MRLTTACFLCCISAAASQMPAHTASLRSPQLEVLLDRDNGLPYEYRLLVNQAVIHGATGDQHVTATVFQAQTHTFEKAELTPSLGTPPPLGVRISARPYR
jgi:hypothetical protein